MKIYEFSFYLVLQTSLINIHKDLTIVYSYSNINKHKKYSFIDLFQKKKIIF